MPCLPGRFTLSAMLSEMVLPAQTGDVLVGIRHVASSCVVPLCRLSADLTVEGGVQVARRCTGSLSRSVLLPAQNPTRLATVLGSIARRQVPVQGQPSDALHGGGEPFLAELHDYME
jgi:hypothetical protein